MGNLVTDAMRAKYPGVDAASPTPAVCGRTSSSPRPVPVSSPARSRGARCSQSSRSATGDDHHDRRPAADGDPERLHPVLRPELRRRQPPLPADLRPQGAVPLHRDDAVVDRMWKAPNGDGGTSTPVGPTDIDPARHQRLHVRRRRRLHRFAGGTDVAQPGDDLLQVAIDSSRPTHRSTRWSKDESSGPKRPWHEHGGRPRSRPPRSSLPNRRRTAAPADRSWPGTTATARKHRPYSAVLGVAELISQAPNSWTRRGLSLRRSHRCTPRPNG